MKLYRKQLEEPQFRSIIPCEKIIAELRNMINSSERSDILVFNCHLCHVIFLLTYYVCSTKIGEISDISECFENFVSQTLGVLTRVYAAELRYRVYANKEFFYKDIFYTPRVSTATQNKRSGDN